MKFAFCFLTYRNIIHTSQWAPYFETNNVYIHPKQRDYISDDYRSFVIPTIINTSWGDRSIVDATILLLEQAILDNNNQWFILCSEDSCPLKPYSEFLSFFEMQTKSIFNVMDDTKNKTSQWWALCRADVELLLQNKPKFSQIFDNISKRFRKQAVDELFFLNALKQFNSNYTFTNGCVHYVKWFSEWVSKHPTTFNRLLDEDIQNINANSCWFIRKTFPTFQNQLIDKKSTCIIMCIGSESVGNYTTFLNYIAGKANVFLLVMDPTKLIEETQLKESCEQAFYVVWNMADKAMDVLYNKFSLIYDNVFVLKEKFNYTTITYPADATFDFLKTTGEVYTPSIALPQPPIAPPTIAPPTIAPHKAVDSQTISLRDYNRNYKVAFLFLVIEDINYPQIWGDYFERNKQFVNIYCHAKYPEKTRTEWLRRNMIQNIRPTGWGYIVDAYFSLFHAALRDKNNMRFVVISESCLPIYSLDTFLDMLDKDDYRTSYVHFMRVSPYDISARIKTQRGYERFGDFTKHYARFCLSRYHIEKLVNSQPSDIDFFKNMHVGDEFFLTLLHAHPGYDYIKQYTITYDNWEDVNAEVRFIKDKIDRIKRDYDHMLRDEYERAKHEVDRLTGIMNDIRKNPKTYRDITPYDIERAFYSGAFFWRKFAPGIRDIYRFYKSGSLIKHERRRGGYKNKKKTRKELRGIKNKKNKTKKLQTKRRK
jgi:hypothetical protein